MQNYGWQGYGPQQQFNNQFGGMNGFVPMNMDNVLNADEVQSLRQKGNVAFFTQPDNTELLRNCCTHTNGNQFTIIPRTSEDGKTYYRCSICGKEWEAIDPSAPNTAEELKRVLSRLNDYIQSIKMYARTAPAETIRTVIASYASISEALPGMWAYAQREGQIVENNMNTQTVGGYDYTDYNTINQFNNLCYGFGGYPQQGWGQQPMQQGWGQPPMQGGWQPQQQAWAQPQMPQQQSWGQPQPQFDPQQQQAAGFPQSVASGANPAYGQQMANPLGTVAVPQPPQAPQAGFNTTNVTATVPDAPKPATQKVEM